MTKPDKPILVHGWMSIGEMIRACGLRFRARPGNPVTIEITDRGRVLHEAATMKAAREWLQREGWIA